MYQQQIIQILDDEGENLVQKKRIKRNLAECDQTKKLNDDKSLMRTLWAHGKGMTQEGLESELI